MFISSSFKIIVSVFIFLLFSFSSAYSLEETLDSSVTQDIKKFELPSLLESIRFENGVSFCDMKIPLQNQSVKERLEKEMLLALWDRPQIILWIKRASKFFPHIEAILKEENLPLDLKYVAVVESALRAHSTSSRNAVGYWQFIESTGKEYGLRIDTQIDERKNIFKSTRAACKYIKNLYEQFDSYLLVLAAYNMGENALKSEIKAQGRTDYYSLYLPLETQRYIFKIIVTSLIMENPEKYGFLFKKEDLYPLLEFDQVNFNSPRDIPLSIIANAADISFKEVKDMNPEIKGYYLAKGKKTILIPKGRADGFQTNFIRLYTKWDQENTQRYHVVKKGENLTKIAKKYNISLSNLMKINNFSINHIIHPGNRLLIEQAKNM